MKPPSHLILVGEPKPGFKPLSDLIIGSGVTVRSYMNRDANGHDRIDDVPFTFLGQEYQHITQVTPIVASPPQNDPWGIFAYHHSTLYKAAIASLDPMPDVAAGVTDADIVDLAVGIYDYAEIVPVPWDHYDSGINSDGICWGLRALQGADIVVFRGSATLEDWIRDFDCVATPWVHDRLGPVHPGFYLGVDQALAEVAPMLRPHVPWVVTGHSLGAARAAIVAGLACV